jgi:hypothetical protein
VSASGRVTRTSQALSVRPSPHPSPPLCPARHRPQSVAACLSIVPRRILSRMGTKSRETIYGRIDTGSGRAGDGSTQASRPARLRGVEQAHARLSRSGAAIARAGRRDQRRIWLSRSENVLAATPTRPLRSTSSGDRRQRRSMSLSDTCAARTARKFAAIRTSAAIWSRCAPPRSRRVIRPRRGGRVSDE